MSNYLSVRDLFIQEHGREPNISTLHLCPEWDYMAIDSSCKEFQCCICEEWPHNKRG